MSKKPLRVVYAEDDELVRDTVSEMLRHLGADVRVCKNGAEAVLLCLSLNPDVALLDLSMLGMDGFDGAARIRANDAERQTRLVALTGRSTQYTEQAMQSGFDEYLTKPMSMDVLESALTRWNATRHDA